MRARRLSLPPMRAHVSVARATAQLLRVLLTLPFRRLLRALPPRPCPTRPPSSAACRPPYSQRTACCRPFQPRCACRQTRPRTTSGEARRVSYSVWRLVLAFCPYSHGHMGCGLCCWLQCTAAVGRCNALRSSRRRSLAVPPSPSPVYRTHHCCVHFVCPSHNVPLPCSAPSLLPRLARKLYDIMLLNTSPSPLPLLPADPGGTATAAAAAAAVAAGAQGGTSKGSVAGGGGNSSSTPAASSPSVWAWSTPDRTPHAWQWLWDSCFHALGMNPLNHTLAWEQLKVGCRQGCTWMSKWKKEWGHALVHHPRCLLHS